MYNSIFMLILKYDRFPIVATTDLLYLSPTYRYDKIENTLAFFEVVVWYLSDDL